MGRFDEARDAFRNAIRIDALNGVAHDGLAGILESEGKIDAAHVNLAQLYARQGKTEESIHQFRLAVHKKPRYPKPVALANLGVHHFNNGEFETLYRTPDWPSPEAISLLGKLGRDYCYLGTIGWFDTVTLPLQKGENELWLAVSESFGGWGVQAAFESTVGLTIVN